MATRFSTALPQGLRYEPTPKRVRAYAAGRAVADTVGARLVWEPERVVPIYAVPEEDLDFSLLRGSDPAARPHTAPLAQAWELAAPGGPPRGHAAWRYQDPDMAGHVVLRWNAFDAWREEEDEVFGHARDPFHRVDMRASARHVTVSDGDTVLADSSRPLLVFETGLPVRHYLPREDVRMDLLEPTDTQTICAYKGFASYFRVPGGGEDAWTYPDPSPDHPMLRGLVCFLGERLDITVDGVEQARPRTQWA